MFREISKTFQAQSESKYYLDFWENFHYKLKKRGKLFVYFFLHIFLLDISDQNNNGAEKERKDKTSFIFIITCSLSRMKALLSLAYLATK